MNNRHDFKLTFLTNSNESFVMRIPRANPDLNDVQVAQAMQGIISSDVVESVRGIPRHNQSAKLLTTQYLEYDLFA
jgi:hypothetical protein